MEPPAGPVTPGEAPPRPRRPGLPVQTLIGLGVGAASGLAAGALGLPADVTERWIRPLGQIFLRLILMVVVPLVVSALILGVAGLGDVRRLGRLGIRTLVLAVFLSGISVLIGLGLANTVRPGARMDPVRRRQIREKYAPPGAPDRGLPAAKPLLHVVRDLIPENPLREMAGALDPRHEGGGMLAVMIFALMAGVAATLAPARAGPLLALLEGVYDLCMVVIGWAMRLAPAGVAALVFALSATLGLDALRTLVLYVLTVAAGLALHLFGVYPLLLGLLARADPRRFFSRSAEVLVTAFGTSSSNATLPTALRVAEERLGLRPEVARFVLTVGATANQNGTALYEGITVLFLAQIFGKDLTLSQQATVLLMCVLAGVGTAGVPGGSLPLVAAVLATLQIPVEALGIVLGVDRLLDMCRTTVNVAGDLVVAACVNEAERPPPSSPVT